MNHETGITQQKSNKKNYKAQFLINPTLKDKIKKTNQLKKEKKDSS